MKSNQEEEKKKSKRRRVETEWELPLISFWEFLHRNLQHHYILRIHTFKKPCNNTVYTQFVRISHWSVKIAKENTTKLSMDHFPIKMAEIAKVKEVYYICIETIRNNNLQTFISVSGDNSYSSYGDLLRIREWQLTVLS